MMSDVVIDDVRALGHRRGMEVLPALRMGVADAAYILLRVSGWTAMTLLASFGVGILFFLMLGNFTALGFFSQIANLGTRFVAADEARRAGFADQLFWAWMIALALVGLSRARLLVAIATTTKGSRHV